MEKLDVKSADLLQPLQVDVKSAATILCAASRNNKDTASRLAEQLASLFEFFIRHGLDFVTDLHLSLSEQAQALIRATKKNLMVWTIRNTRQEVSEVELEFLSQGQGW